MGFERAEDAATLVAVMRHPLRSRLLYMIGDLPGTSAAQLAARSGEPIAKVRRHLRHLLSVGAVVVSGREEKRGASQSFYRINGILRLTQGETEAGGEDAEREVTVGVLRAIVTDMQGVASLHGGSRQEDDCIGRVGGSVDAQGWKELAEIHEEALLAAYRAKQRAEERLAASGEAPLPFASAILCFEVER